MSSHSLSTRRGSVSARDPYGAHVRLRRPSTSTLTIVRLPATPSSLQEPSQFNKKFTRRSAPSTAAQPEHPRLSFATSSFANDQSRPDGHSPSGSPNTSPRIRPSLPHRFSQGIMAKPRLSAEQIVEIAKQAKNVPPPNPQSPTVPHRPQSPHTLSPPTSAAHPAPATFTPLPDDIYLPFIHRTEEVSQLISSHPTAKLFALLKQAFSNKDDAQLPPNTIPPGDSVHWSYFQLIHHLTKVDRDVCSDADWVFSAHRCIMSHSELIWERVKAALGIPPELDFEEEPEERLSMSFDIDESAILDSPMLDRASDKDEQAQFTARLRRRLLNTQESGSVADTSAITTHENVFGADEQTTHGIQSPTLSEVEELESGHLTIEPLLSNSNSHPPPLSLPASLSAPTSDGGLGDIAEGAEEEVEEEEGTDESKKEKPLEDDFIDPSHIQGLRISTGCFSPNESAISSPVIGGSMSSLVRTSSESSIRSGNFSNYLQTTAGAGQASSSSEEEGTSATDMLGDRVLDSTTMRARFANYRRTRPASVSGYDSREWNVPYNPVAERGLGNPLFPSNFARLALEPTLRANSALRSPARYVPGMGHKARSQSWVAGRTSAESEYASEGSMGE
ncbi:hypothetical protein AX15_002914 [Amanita polypyramis BW_CC]|nr:hypothetical protein AX15_002914 [Amanita polypyramis BW_CC]